MSDLIEPRPAARLGRFAALAGIAFPVLTMAGYQLMGKNPEPDASISAITSYWGPHHAHVYTAGILLGYATVLFALFGIAIWSRIRDRVRSPLVAGTALVGVAVATTGLFASAMTYFMLGDIGDKPTTLPATLQTLHVFGSELSFPVAGGVELLLFAVAAAGIAGSAFPRWLAWSALVIGALQLTTIGFTAFLVFLLWAAVASVYMVLRPDAARPTAREGAASPLVGSTGTVG